MKNQIGGYSNDGKKRINELDPSKTIEKKLCRKYKIEVFQKQKVEEQYVKKERRRGGKGKMTLKANNKRKKQEPGFK